MVDNLIRQNSGNVQEKCVKPQFKKQNVGMKIRCDEKKPVYIAAEAANSFQILVGDFGYFNFSLFSLPSKNRELMGVHQKRLDTQTRIVGGFTPFGKHF